MPEATGATTADLPEQVDPLTAEVRAAASGLEEMVARARTVQQERADQARAAGAPRWTDVFTTQFTEFTNRPR